jgi:putative FmdB family regulatory protein
MSGGDYAHYEYTCRKCGNEFEVIVFGDDVPECPECGAKDPQKNMSSFGFSVGSRSSRRAAGRLLRRMLLA